MEQGTNSVLEYSVEFMTLLIEIGDGYDRHWAKNHFLHGLYPQIRRTIGPLVSNDDIIDTLTTRTQRAYEFIKLDCRT